MIPIAVLLGAALVCAPATAAPDAPAVRPWPAWLTTPFSVVWDGARFDPYSLQRGYDVEFVDPADDTVFAVRRVEGEGPGRARVIHTPLASGAAVRARVRSTQIPCVETGPAGCVRWSSVREESPWAVVDAHIDSVAPSGTVRVEYDAPYITGLDVPLLLTGTDPAPGAGMGAVQIASALPFTCAPTVADDTCPIAFQTGPFTIRLPQSTRDGRVWIYAAFRDAAVPYGEPASVLTGNAANIGFTSVFLDRVAPTPVGTVTVDGPVAGVYTVTLDGRASHDDDGGGDDSGIADTGYRWTHPGGPTLASTARFAVTEPAAYPVRLTVTDAAGNAASADLTAYVGVSPPIPPPTTTPGPAPVAPPAAPRVASLRVPPMRQGRLVRVRVVTTTWTRVTLELRRRTGRPGVAVRRTRMADATGAEMRFTAPRAGVYTLRVTAGAHIVTRRVRVR